MYKMIQEYLFYVGCKKIDNISHMGYFPVNMYIQIINIKAGVKQTFEFGLNIFYLNFSIHI